MAYYYHPRYWAPAKPARARDVQRRRTAVVTYDPGQAGQTLEYDDLGTMSDLELPSFQRGGFMRTSLPIVRSASTSLERPLGLVFLVYGDQTKKSLLPNEITTLDTVRALFVRAFPNLTLEMLESPRNKIYLLDPATNIYFQLEDLGEIKDRSVLKIHETDSNEPQKVKERQEVRGRTVQMPASRSRQGFGELPVGHNETFTKAHSLPPQVAHNYSELMQDQRGQWEMERRSRSRTPEPAERPRSLSAGATSRQRFSHSPDRLPTPERGPLNPIPENRQLPPGYRDQGNYYESVAPANYRGPSPYPSGIYEAPAGYPGYPPASTVPAQQTYVARSTRAAPLAHPQRAVAPGAEMRQGGPQDAGYTRSQGYRVPPGERDGPGGDTTRNRIEKMEQQLANLTAWVHYQKSDGTRRDSTPPPRSLGSTTSESSDTFPASSASKHKGETPTISTIATTTNNVVQTQGLSDIPDGLSHTQRSSGLSSRESTPLSAQAEASFKVAQLRSDLHVLRRQQQLNMEAMRDEFMAVFTKVKKVLSSVPGAENQVNFHKRTEATVAKNTYLGDKQQADKELSDLEASVEELRTDVISRQCRVNANDVEGMALLLSNITKSLADIKARFPAVNSQMMEVLEAERKVIENEEKFLKDEPGEIENSLKRCKKLTGTLYTLKRLASVQDHRPPSVPSMPPTSLGSPLAEQKTALLENIRAVVPDHDYRVQQMEAADASRERKKKISSQQEALKFGKSLEMATKNLRPSSTNGSDDGNKDGRKNSDGYSGGQVKPAVPAKPILSSSSSPLHTSPTATSSSSTVTAANVASVKPSFSAALTTAKSSSDKPTATVSAMTAGVADTVTTTVTRMTEKESGQSGIKGFPNSATQTSGNLTNTVHGGTGTVTQTVKVGTHSPKKKDASIYTYQVCGPVSPVFPLPPDVFTDNGVSNGTSSSKEMEGKSKSDLTKKGSVSFSNPPVTGSVGVSSPVNGHSDSKAETEKVDLATQKQNARSAFFSSLNSPPTSPSSKRDSACLDPGPVVSPGLVGKVTPGPTINLVLSGTASPKSPTSPGSFNISPPEELKSPPAESKTTATSSSSSAPLPSPTRGIPRFVPESKSSSFDSHSSPSSQTDAGGGKQKKVPPPPPPRKGSRPTSACISPVNGGTQDPTAQETPKFVGGILGQHRLSGGPLSSTPKPASQQKPVTQFEKDLASGVYANMNRPDVQNQKSSPQQMISEANAPGTSSPYRSKESSQSSSQEEGPPIPPPPSVTIALDREERGSSSESTSSSSGTSMGSQQSVIHVARSASVIEKGTGKPKPEPPRRQSSLLSKFTGSRDSKNKMNNGKAKVNGVDL